MTAELGPHGGLASCHTFQCLFSLGGRKVFHDVRISDSLRLPGVSLGDCLSVTVIVVRVDQLNVRRETEINIS